ncbi:hypothetical protein K8352_05935 [Flavobacteriaceae bacterium F89]|uniref:Pyruvate kinase n=1 Tax=Cerina litoralis TaxID=2874477 RepID=A0AAE3EV84_9FLAO|nr:pyruvate kinase [Cerina litoralis]MCG2460281.1 hypothetical protein [Cerina litoralis]
MLKKLERELEKIYHTILDRDPLATATAKAVDERYRPSAINLYRYLVLRSIDIRKIQGRLSELGISSLGSGAGYVLDNVSNALKLIKLLKGKTWEKDGNLTSIGYLGSRQLLQAHVNSLFDVKKKKRDTIIMVTMPDEAADDLDLLKNLMSAGMKIARINLSHGDKELWKRILGNIHKASETLGLPIKIYMDLPGPKIRVSAISIFDENSGKWVSKKSIAIQNGNPLCLRKDDFKGDTVGLSKIDVDPIPQVSVSLPQIIDDLQIGHRVFFDDGAVEAVVISKSSKSLQITINHAYKRKLRREKGINLPDTSLSLPSLTQEDLELLPFVGEHADTLGYSFVRKPEDVARLYGELQKLGISGCGIVLKIENREAFENLPLILLEAMKDRNIGVMIARGDLAVEVGFERISEVQNQILWLCEAAHIPVIWATQVLDHLAKKGIATRAEISDATISAQAECVMLNKGPHIVETVKVLKNILVRMKGHSLKNKNTLRALDVAKSSLAKIER